MTTEQDITDSAGFQAVRTELDKLEQLQAAPVDWSLVAAWLLPLRATYPLDLRLACWQARTVIETADATSLHEALRAIEGLLRDHWEAFTPQSRKLRSRLAPLGWLHDKLVPRLRGGVAGGDAEGVRALRAAVQDILAIVAVRAPEASLDFFPLLALLADPLPTVSPRQPAQASVGEPPMPALGDTTTPRALRRVLGDLAERLVATDPGDALAYRLARAAAWREVKQPPPADAAGITVLLGVPVDRVRGYRDLAATGQYERLLPQLEVSVGRCVFWLDGQRLVADSLAALGHETAAGAVTDETRRFLARLPQLAELKFSDGRPFAEAATVQWLSRESQAAAAPPEISPDLTREAVHLYRQGRMAEAFLLLEQGLARPGRERFLAALALARFHLELGQKGIALLHLEKLNDEFDARNLVGWEPDLGNELASLLLTTASGPLAGERNPRLVRARERLDHISHGVGE